MYFFIIFFFNDTATTEIYTLSLHDALPILNKVMNEVDKEVIEKHWAGDNDILDLIQNIIEKADQMIGGGAWRRVRKYLNKNRLNGDSDHHAE